LKFFAGDLWLCQCAGFFYFRRGETRRIAAIKPPCGGPEPADGELLQGDAALKGHFGKIRQKKVQKFLDKTGGAH
jgi:hypothetical protein